LHFASAIFMPFAMRHFRRHAISMLIPPLFSPPPFRRYFHADTLLISFSPIITPRH
jgi:hypothetical protein